MNRLAVSISILAVMSVGCAASVAVSCHVTDRMEDMVDNIEDAFHRGDMKRCNKAAEELSDIWEDMLHYSILITDLGHAVEITSSIAEISSFAEMENEEIYAACDRAQAQIELLRSAAVPTFWKII
ncbi:MAG: DUF4363 family protein [Oscillospiraceae bacterium]|nr:DUF4363 family protein [Oscillospiraceae bacterium]